MSMEENLFFPRLATPANVGRGRAMPTPIPFSIDSPTPGVDMRSLESVPGVHGLANHHTSSPTAQVTSTPNATGDNSESVSDQMRAVIQEIGHQLADSIISRMQSHNTVAPSTSATQNATSTLCQHSHVTDSSQVHVVTQRKVKEPPYFVGDGSDSVTVYEWEDLNRTFIRKSNVRVEEQAEEILMHLRGKAKDVVRCGIRNNNTNISTHPDVIYSLLRRHFCSTTYSAVPLADFYSILPKDQEDPYD